MWRGQRLPSLTAGRHRIHGPRRSSLYLGVAFQYEIEFAIPQSRDAAQSLLNLAMRCADAGLLQYYTPFTLHRQLAAAGAELTGPPCAAPALAADVTPWTLFAACDEKLGKEVWTQLAKDGFAVIPSFLGACQAGEVRVFTVHYAPTPLCEGA